MYGLRNPEVDHKTTVPIHLVAPVHFRLECCHRDFGPGDFGPAGPKSPEFTTGILTKITRDIGPAPDILVRVADLRLGSR